jgi:hypothetical protein
MKAGRGLHRGCITDLVIKVESLAAGGWGVTPQTPIVGEGMIGGTSTPLSRLRERRLARQRGG